MPMIAAPRAILAVGRFVICSPFQLRPNAQSHIMTNSTACKRFKARGSLHFTNANRLSEDESECPIVTLEGTRHDAAETLDKSFRTRASDLAALGVGC